MNKFLNSISRSFTAHLYLWICGLILLYTLSDVFFTYSIFGQFFYVDTDCYTHATRIIHWLQNFSWYEQVYPYSNYPDGEVFHFTRLLDLIWTSLALPLMPFFSLKDAIFYSGMIISPLAMALSLIVIFWGLKPYIANSEKVLFFSCILSLSLLIKFDNVFDFNRPDHHSVIFLFFAYNISAVLLNLSQKRFRLLFFAGILAGFGIWISSAVEGFILTGAILSLLVFNWIFEKIPLKALQIYSLGLFLATTFAFLINPPYGGYFVFDNTRLCAIHVVLTLFIFLSFRILSLFHIQSKSAKIFSLAGCALFSLLLLCLLFSPSTLFAPVYTEEVKLYFLPYIMEMQPSYIFTYEIEMAFWLIAVILLTNFYKSDNNQFIARNLTYLSLYYFIPFAFVRRFSPYELCLLTYLNIVFINKLFTLDYSLKNTKIIAITYMYAAIFILCSFTYIPCLPVNSAIVPQNSSVLTNIFSAPQLIFDKQVKVIGIPYHPASFGIAENHKLFHSTDENEIKRLLQKHNIEYIYMPINRFYQAAVFSTEDEKKFHRKLITGKNLYPWLNKIDTKTEDLLYKIDYQKF